MGSPSVPRVLLLSLLPGLSPAWIQDGCWLPLELAWYGKERLPVSYSASLGHVPASNPVLGPGGQSWSLSLPPPPRRGHTLWDRWVSSETGALTEK